MKYRIAAIGALCLLSAVLIAVWAVPRQVGGTTPSVAPAVAGELDYVTSAATFQVRLPHVAPPGYVLTRALLTTPDVNASANEMGVSAVDLFYRTEDGRQLHFWQTDSTHVSKDPTLDPDASVVDVEGRPWVVHLLDAGAVVQLSHRFDDGVLVTMDVSGDMDDARLTAGSLTLVTSP